MRFATKDRKIQAWHQGYNDTRVVPKLATFDATQISNITGCNENILTGMPHYVIGEVFLSCERLAAKIASKRRVICVRPHMVQ